MNVLTETKLKEFETYLYMSEKAEATVTKYVGAVRRLAEYLQGMEISKQFLLIYRDHLLEKMKPQTVNGALTAINLFLDFCGWAELRIKMLKVQHQAFLDESRELSQEEYRRLLSAARSKGNTRLFLLMTTICGTGIRVSELPCITVEAAHAGRAEVRLKGKIRTVLLPRELRKKLLQYAKEQGIREGYIFRTRSGRPLDRSNICHDMKKLCEEADVDSSKVFPHNLRHLFARTFYAIEKNLAHLADVLGHSNIETTRIYVAVSAAAHEQVLNRMGLVV